MKKKNKKPEPVVTVKPYANFVYPMIHKRDIDTILDKHELSYDIAFSDECRWELRGASTTDCVVQQIVEELKKIYRDVDYMDLEGVCEQDMIVLTW